MRRIGLALASGPRLRRSPRRSRDVEKCRARYRVWALVPLAGEVACASPATTTTRDTPVSGLATAHEFVKEGAFVFVTGRREAELAAAVNEIEGKAAVIRGDVSNSDDLDCLFSQIASEKGKLDVVFVAKNICTHLR